MQPGPSTPASQDTVSCDVLSQSGSWKYTICSLVILCKQPKTVSSIFEHFTFSEQMSALSKKGRKVLNLDLRVQTFLHCIQVWALQLFLHSWGLTRGSVQIIWIYVNGWFHHLKETHTWSPSTCPQKSIVLQFRNPTFFPIAWISNP